MTSRMWPIASAPDSTPQKNSPAFTIGPTGCSWNSNSVTTPKLPPPPRSAQCRSAFSVGRRVHDAAVGGHDRRADTRLSQLRPCLRDSQPMPPPSVSPADAGVADHAARHREAVLLRGRVELGPGRAAAAARALRAGIDGDRRSSG